MYIFFVLVGVGLALWFEDWLLRKIKSWATETGDFKKVPLNILKQPPAEFPQSVLDFYASSLEKSDPESCTWLNELISVVVYKYKGKEEIQQMVISEIDCDIEGLKEKNITSLKYIKVLDFDMGDSLPKMSNVQVLNGDPKTKGLNIMANLRYDGGISITIETALTFGLVIQFKVSVPLVTGCICLELLNNEMKIFFDEEPHIALDIKLKASNHSSTKISKFVRNKIISTIHASLVRPKFILIPLNNYEEKTHLISVTVLGANDLSLSQDNKKPSTFLKIAVGDLEFQSPTLKKTCNPQWNYSAKFETKENDKYVTVEVFQESNDIEKFIGFVTIPLLLGEDTAKTRSLQIQSTSTNENVSGYLTVEIKKSRLDGKKKQDDAKAKTSESEAFTADDEFDADSDFDNLVEELKEENEQEQDF